MSRAWRGKRRSHSQKIGEQGEKFFASWAVARRMSATKADADYGVDFFCQVFDVTTEIEESSGTTIGVQVRSTGATPKPAIKIDRTDAVNLLRQQQATCLIGVNLALSDVHFQFLDEKMVDFLHGFLHSDHDSVKIPLSSMPKGDSEFDRALRISIRAATQQRMKIYRAEKVAHLRLPGATVTVEQNSRGGVATIDAPWIGRAFLVPPEKRESIRTNFFGLGVAPDIGAGIFFRPELYPAFDLADTSTVLRGVLESEVVIHISNGDNRADAMFRMRQFGDECAYTHSSCLCLIWSEARRRENNTYVHDMYVHLSEPTSLLGSPEDGRDFLKLLRPGSVLSRAGNQWTSVENWGEQLARMGSQIEWIERVFSFIGVPLSKAALRDLANREFTSALFYIDSIVHGRHAASELFPGFVLGIDEDTPVDSLPSVPVRLRIPVVLNIKDVGVVLWTEVSAVRYLNQAGDFAGLRFRNIISFKSEIFQRFEKSQHPEIWISDKLPAIECGRDHLPESRSLSPDFDVALRRGIQAEFLDRVAPTRRLADHAALQT